MISEIGLTNVTKYGVMAPLVEFEDTTDMSVKDPRVVIYTLKFDVPVLSMLLKSLAKVEIVKDPVGLRVLGF